MKKVFLWLLGVVVSYQLSAQSRLIITDDYRDGKIYEVQLNGLGLTKTAEFSPKNRGGYPISFIKHDSSYYGITDYYGVYDYGTIYRYDHPNDSITVLHNFVDDSPTDLIAGPNNVLYGTWNDGDLFSYNLSTNILSNLGNCGGSSTYQQLMLASNGKIYGTTRYGGTNNLGIVFEFNPVGNVITVLHHFSGTDGERPRVELVEAADGLLYGVTYEGGIEDKGTIFSIDPSTSTFSVEYEFDASVSGSYPQTNLVATPDGLVYGVLRQGADSNGGGGLTERVANSNSEIFFSFSPATNQFTNKANIDYDEIGEDVYELSLIDGEIYGMTDEGGGDEGEGSLFKYSISGDSLSVVLQFDEYVTWGEGKVLPGTDSELIYASGWGNSSDDGAIITVNTATQETDMKVVFNEYPAGEEPDGVLVQTSNNRFFGLTSDGGKYGGGTIYEYLPNTKQVVGRYHFSYDSLYLSNYFLTEGLDGLLYGAVEYEPPSSCVSCRTSNKVNPLLAIDPTPSTETRYLFSFNTDTYELKLLLDFNTVDGDYPYYSYQFDSDNLYGVVSQGGTNDRGGIFRFNLQNEQYELLLEFDNTTTGRNARTQALVNGYLYGLTQSGAANNYGAIYKYDIANDQVTIVKNFNSSDKRSTNYGFIPHPNGKLYVEMNGTNYGALVEVDPATDAVSNEFNFTDKGLRTLGQSFISVGSDGKIYGSFYNPNKSSRRGIYTYDPSTDTFEDLMAPNSYVQQTGSFQALAACIAPLAIQPEDEIVCAGQPWSVALNSQNTVSYEWKKDGVVITNATTDAFTIDSTTVADAGIYTVVMTNACGTDSVSFTLRVSDIELEAAMVDVKCYGNSEGSIVVTASGGIAPYEYSLDGTTFQTEATFVDLAAGDYTITVRDSISCIASVAATIGEPEALSLSTTGKDETCEKGFISVTPFSGVGPYEYSLDGITYQESDMFKDVSAGEYTVYVRDANGCVATESYTVGLVAALEVASTVTESTEYPENGSISLSVTGGAAPYTYAWNTGDSTAVISDLVPNDYSVMVTDRNGCSVEVDFTVGGVTAIADLEKQGISIYPNPVIDQLQVRLPINTSVRSAQLYSAQGELMRQFSLAEGLNQLKAEGLKPGMYLLQLDSGVSTRIVIKK